MMSRRTGIAFCSALALAVSAIAVPAEAGLDFTDTVTANQGVTSPNVRFNGVTAAVFGTQAQPGGFAAPGVNRVVVSAPGAVGLIPEIANLYYNYTNAANPQWAFSYANGDGDYDMVIQMGDIVVDPSGVLLLTTVSFREPGGLFSSSYGINRVLTAADSGRTLFIDIPTAVIPAIDRNDVETVSLTFVMIGPGTSFGINAVANPEPGTIALFGLGALGLVGLVRRRRKAKLAVEPSA